MTAIAPKRSTAFAVGGTRAVIIHIDSPGGTTTGSEELHQALRRVAQKNRRSWWWMAWRPRAATWRPWRRIISSRKILRWSGSIGVLFQYPNLTDLLDKIGVKMEEIKSSPLKAAPNGLEPTSPEARAAIEALVSDSFAWFKDIVKERRKLDGEALDRVTDGRVFTGRQAIDLKLADEIGREQEAIDWLAKTNNIDPATPVRDWRLSRRFSELSFLHLGMAKILDIVGLGFLAHELEKGSVAQAVEKAKPGEGLLALWYP